MRITAVLIATLTASLGCAAELDLGEGESAIVGGTPDVNGFPSACILDIDRPPDDEGTAQDPLVCSCVLVGERAILTTAQCVVDNATADEGEVGLEGIEVRFGADRSGDPIPVESAALYRYFDPEGATSDDLALLTLTEAPAGVAPAVLNDQPLGADDVDNTVTVVGYGLREEGNPASTGSRRIAALPISLVSAKYIETRDPAGEITTCFGDSGGPVFLERGGEQVLVAISATHRQTSLDQAACQDNIRRLRVDAYLDDFIDPYVNPSDAECAWQDDPSMCTEDCPTRDWDCPLGAFVGEACDQSGECEEGGRCVAAVDDESFTFCSRPCDLEGGGADCPTGMECADDGAGGGECVWLAPSPGSQGYTCSSGDQCRSGICEDTICVNPCDPEDPASCPAEFDCGPSKVVDGMNVCLGTDLSGGGGFCAIGPAGSERGQNRGGFALLALLCVGMGLVLRRR